MGWPYEFRGLSQEEVQLRRHTLDLYACIAHYSALAPAFIFLVYRLVRHVASRVGRGWVSDKHTRYTAVPASPVAKAHQRSSSGKLASRSRQLAWWLGDDIYFAGSHLGQRDEWLLGAAWTAWLLILCVRGTGRDYFHLTKRFGAVAVSQLPIQYLLSLKSLNPFAWVFRSSHEHINRYHRVLGRIIYGLVLVHIILYNTYFLIAGIWLKRILETVVLCGALASLAFDGLMVTALRTVRAYSYRLFFIVHLAAALSVPVLLFFHASSALVYLVESLVMFLVDLAVRRINTINSPSTLETIPGTDLVKIDASIPLHKLAAFRAVPGLHIYLSIPPASRPSFAPLYDLLYNPFTIASVNEQEGTIRLVARISHGPLTKILSDFSSQSSRAPRQFALDILGPYGTMSSHFKHLLAWNPSKILLISGGVGATFTLPIYQALLTEHAGAKLQFVWVIRSAGDATWATGKNVLDDPNIHLFLTGDMGIPDHGGNSIELSQLSRNGRPAAHQNHKRPDVGKIVDDVFRSGLDDSVAILVCGPVEMARLVRQRARSWVMKGRRVWWHGEIFGW